MFHLHGVTSFTRTQTGTLCLCFLATWLYCDLAVARYILQAYPRMAPLCTLDNTLLRTMDRSSARCNLSPNYMFSDVLKDSNNPRMRYMKHMAYLDYECLTSYKTSEDCNNALTCIWAEASNACYFYLDPEGVNMLRVNTCKGSLLERHLFCYFSGLRGSCPSNCMTRVYSGQEYCLTERSSTSAASLELLKQISSFDPSVWGSCPGLDIAQYFAAHQNHCGTISRSNITGCLSAVGCTWSGVSCVPRDLSHALLMNDPEPDLKYVHEAITICMRQGPSQCLTPNFTMVSDPTSQELGSREGTSVPKVSKGALAGAIAGGVGGILILMIGGTTLVVWNRRKSLRRINNPKTEAPGKLKGSQNTVLPQPL